VLKVSTDLRETPSEIASLAAFDGRGAAQLLESDAELGGLLLEQIEPGTMLAEYPGLDDDAATRIAANLLGELWRPADSASGITPIESWCAAYARNRDVLSRGVSGFPRELFQHADALRAQLVVSTDDPVVLHGDLHHFNILRSHRAGWLAIDPKGLLGDRCFDVCQFLVNPGPVPPSVNSRRLDIFCAELGLDPVRTRQWCVVHAVLNACWAFEDGEDWTRRVAYAQQALGF
jgi:streptomycin 6-kinase